MSYVLEMCSVCSRVQDKEGTVFSHTKWGDFSTFVNESKLPASSVVLISTYCPDCAESYRVLMAYGRTGQFREPLIA